MGKSIHKLSRHKLYPIWNQAKYRCYSPDNPGYQNYGGRDIRMCDEWRNDFKAFYYYMMSLPHAMERGYSIDRIDNNGNYEQDNMRWANRHMQVTNRSVLKNNKSGYTGISYNKKLKKWVANINVLGVRAYLGLYTTIHDAVITRNVYIICNGLIEYEIQKIKP